MMKYYRYFIPQKFQITPFGVITHNLGTTDLAELSKPHDSDINGSEYKNALDFWIA